MAVGYWLFSEIPNPLPLRVRDHYHLPTLLMGFWLLAFGFFLKSRTPLPLRVRDHYHLPTLLMAFGCWLLALKAIQSGGS
jgi:hypothetical protein